MSLGGVRDEAEIRGHRRTYIGSLPGKVLQNMSRTGVRNPLFLFDEVDKMSMDFRGDPSSALLEVLDPEQNTSFSDHYLEVDFDLSEVMFVCTANTLNIPAPLLDRMEVIRLPGYTEDEKQNIARRFLLPKQVKQNGLKDGELTVDDPAILDIIRHYTRESGVRNLERESAKICRKAVKQLLLEPETKKIDVTADNLDKFLGVQRFRFGRAEEANRVGLVTGLAWTEVGGELLTIEAAVVPGKGKLLYTGQLGEVMQESIQAAMTVVRSRADLFGLETDYHQKTGRARARAGGRDAEGRPERRHRHVHRAGLGADEDPGARERRDDRRDHAARRDPADRRAQGKVAGGAARRHRDRADPEREREGPGRDPGEHQGQARHPPGQVDRRGARDRAREEPAGDDDHDRGHASPRRSKRRRNRSAARDAARSSRSSRTEAAPAGLAFPGRCRIVARLPGGRIPVRWVLSSAGRASPLQGECRRFEPCSTHQ